MKKLMIFLLPVLCLAVPSFAYDIPAASNMVRADGNVVIVYTTSGRPAWAALIVSIPGGQNVRLDCGDLAADRGCFQIGAGDRVLIYGHLRPSIECAYDPPCTEVQVDNIRRYTASTNTWSLWTSTGWQPGI